MKRLFPSGFMIFAGVIGIAAASVHVGQDVTKIRKKFDLRETILRKFLRDKNCPDQEYAEVFIAEADSHGLDWRLLPSLAFVESGGGRTAKGNNLFGWDNGKTSFTSFGNAIHSVAASLSTGRSYHGKNLAGKLASFNQGTDYSGIVLNVMKQIYPHQQLAVAK